MSDAAFIRLLCLFQQERSLTDADPSSLLRVSVPALQRWKQGQSLPTEQGQAELSLWMSQQAPLQVL